MRKAGACVGVIMTLAGCFMVLSGMSPKNEKPAVLMRAGDLQWGLGPDDFPLGVRAAILSGNPDEDGPYTMRLRLPPRYRIDPYWMLGEQRITVLSGSVELGLGERFETASLKPYPAGSYLTLPARARFFLKTSHGATLEIHGQGPWQVAYASPADDPRLLGAR